MNIDIPHATVELPDEHTGPSNRCVTAASFGAPLDDQTLIAASEGEPTLFGDDDSAALPLRERVSSAISAMCSLLLNWVRDTSETSICSTALRG
ncbi:hypothetical protein DPX16_4633 [Anabarilius grahami]|uniref:Uncharacterized protein n=1 Tax=Anabarilius grahami TaxID=495550 RepID=A0A3N0YC39_ANAGA|nr:hypothetical protein DPX16_4633 [Anabarilius grahami]